MTGQRLTLIALAAAAVVLAVGAAARLSSASFTTSLTVGGNSITADQLSDHFEVTPGPDAVGDVDGLAIDLGLLDEPQTVSGVFTVRNIGSSTQTATLAFAGDQVGTPVFASSGTASATLAPGAASSVSLTSSAAKADDVTGTLRLSLGSSTWLYRDYEVAFEAAPAAPESVTATPRPGADIEVSWTGSATTANLAGYDVYRSTGGGWTKQTSSPVPATSWTDTSSANNKEYSYRVRAVSTDGLESVDSETATARADSSAPSRPSSVVLANGGGNGNAYLNAGNSDSVAVAVTLGGSSVAENTITLTLTGGGVTVTATAPATEGAGTVTFDGLDASGIPDGSVVLSATASDEAGNTSSARTRTVTKDTVAPDAPTASYVDRRGSQADRITGSAEPKASISAAQTVPADVGPYTATASNGGTYTVTVAAVAGSPSSPVTVTYLLTATDAAGNVGGTTVLTYAVTR
jgi:large repetitive protein